MTRPDGSLPPSPRVARQDRYLRCRRRSGLDPATRAVLDRRRAELVAELDALDVFAIDWFLRRRALLDEALALHEELWPLVPGGTSRRPPRPSARWMPPLPHDARPLEGYGLRLVCQELLARFGVLALPELHALLHLYGYEIVARLPVKALADAMRYEVLEGRAERVQRGVYRTLVDDDGVPRDVDPPLATPIWRTGTFRRRVPQRGCPRGRIRTVRHRGRRVPSPGMDVTIEPATAGDTEGLRDLIVSIQREEFGLGITWEDQPDLADVDGFYRAGAGEFWVARDRVGRVVGSIGLKDCGEHRGALRKMFVVAAHRGPGRHGMPPVAEQLLNTLLRHARSEGFATILLGTTEAFTAAHRFYEKHGFTPIDEDELPPTFPRMAVDTRFYRRDLT